MLGVAASVLTALLLFVFFEVTSQPGFCGSCHLMQPYIEAWEHSSHNEVHCMTCHAREGISGYIETKFTALSMLTNYATGLYKRSRPWAEIEDKNCLTEGCHETRLLEGKIKFVKGINFDHTPHLMESRRGRKLRCTSCHSQIVQGEHISVTTSTCFLCHFKNIYEESRTNLAECTLCHTPPIGDEAFRRDKMDHSDIIEKDIECRTCHQMMWQGTGSVNEERCGVCHSETEHIERINDLEFIHEWHIEKRKVECQRCHSPIEHVNLDVQHVMKGDCRTCHEQLHNPMLSMYEGSGARLIDQAMPDIMHTSGVLCMSCHKDKIDGNGAAEINENTCTPCHEASYLSLARAWRRNYGRSVSTLEKELRKVGNHPQYEDARHDLALLKKGGAWHNPKYADEIIKEVSKVVKEAGGSPIKAPTVTQDSQVCLNCHRGISEANIGLDLSPFNHNEHFAARDISCKKCHNWTDPEKLGHGRLLPSDKSCMQCHHEKIADDSDNCEPCHQSSRNIFFGKIDGLDPHPSPMAESEMTCSDCHDQAVSYSPPSVSFCLDCHDQEVIDDLEFTREEINRSLVKLKGDIDKPTRTVMHDHGRAVHNPDMVRVILGEDK
ncbi:MAG: cytochrome c3 family protein [Candidatus Electryonea clarkiae]|nr:cytochrome c3 family protein [Candidatus Electryonea clarkiae]MDP8287789.1 cytochrome c3 family protein [Candidatus Electryonea clarkiae]